MKEHTAAVLADVFDIRDPNNAPRRHDEIIVDTNVWLAVTALSAASGAEAVSQIDTYWSFLQAGYHANALRRIPLNFGELGYQIEIQIVQRVIKQQDPTMDFDAIKKKANREKKKMRLDTVFRERTVNEIEAAWSQVSELSTPIDASYSDEQVIESISLLRTSSLDPFDALLLKTIAKHRNHIPQVLSMDSDFLSTKCELFTASEKLLRIASAAGQLKSRC